MFTNLFGEAHITDGDASGFTLRTVEQDILWLQVSVNYAVFVEEGYGVR